MLDAGLIQIDAPPYGVKKAGPGHCFPGRCRCTSVAIVRSMSLEHECLTGLGWIAAWRLVVRGYVRCARWMGVCTHQRRPLQAASGTAVNSFVAHSRASWSSYSCPFLLDLVCSKDLKEAAMSAQLGALEMLPAARQGRTGQGPGATGSGSFTNWSLGISEGPDRSAQMAGDRPIRQLRTASPRGRCNLYALSMGLF